MTKSQQEINLLYTIETWVKSHIKENFSMEALQGDAGARKYWRITTNSKSYILAHDPSNLAKYLAYSKEFAKYNINTPKIFAFDLAKELILQEDFGDELLINKTSGIEREFYYKKAIFELIKLQKIPPEDSIWGSYNYEKLMAEMSLTPEWYCNCHLKSPLDEKNIASFNDICHDIASRVIEHSSTLVHRDFHSRNLLITPSGALGIIDFQDAVVGAISYDLASLLRDYYCQIPADLLKKLQKFYLTEAKAKMSYSEFNNIFQLTALQRHLKVLGQFCRLYYRDNKPQYLQHLPTVITYIKDALLELPEYSEIYNIIEAKNHAK